MTPSEEDRPPGSDAGRSPPPRDDERRPTADPCAPPDASDPLADHRERLRLRAGVFMHSTDPVIVEDLDGCIMDLNWRAEQLYGWRRDELVGRSIETLIAEEHRELARSARRSALRGEELDHFEWERVMRDGRRIPALLTLFPVLDDDDRPLAIVSVSKDISEVRRRDLLQRELREAEQAAEIRERRALSRDLHDSVGQLLALMRIRLAALHQRHPDGEVGQQLAVIEALARDADERIRTLMLRVDPGSLHEAGLVGACGELAEAMRERYGLDVIVVRDRLGWTLGGDELGAVYRCIRELLINVSRHAGATRAEIRFEPGLDDGLATIVVEDDGAGFDPAQRPEGLGLLGVRDRMDRCGGAFELASGPGRGTRVRLRIPAIEAPPSAAPTTVEGQV